MREAAATIGPEIRSRNSRVAALQKRWECLRAGLDLILAQRGAEMADVPGGDSGLLVRDSKGKKAVRLVTRIDPGVVRRSTNSAATSRGAAEELEQWKTRVEARKPLDASPTAITLALLLTDEELDSLEKRAGDGEIAGRGRPGGSNVASPQVAAHHGGPAHVFAAKCRASRRARLDGANCGSGIHRLRAGLDLVLDQRGADMADLPGGTSGLLCRDYKGNPVRPRIGI